MSLQKTSLLSGLAAAVKLSTSLALNKILAVYVGPEGYATIGQFQNLISMVTTFASGGIGIGVTKLTSEYSTEPDRQIIVWRTSMMMGLIGSTIFCLLLILFRDPIAQIVLGTKEYSDILVWLAFALNLLVINGLLLSILNGLKAVREFVVANIVGNIAALLIASSLVFFLGLRGVLIAVAVSQAFSLFFTAIIFRRICKLHWTIFFGKIDKVAAKSLGKFTLMAATTALVAPIGQMIIRGYIGEDLGWDISGLWQALLKISETHLFLLISILSVYFLPRYSEIKIGGELQTEVINGYKFVVPIVAASGLALYLFREFLIRNLLTPEFMPIANVLGFQLIGDALKICSWVISFTLVSHARTKIFVITELIFTGIYIVVTIFFAKYFGLLGTSIAYCLTYAAYWAVMYYYFRHLIISLKG